MCHPEHGEESVDIHVNAYGFFTTLKITKTNKIEEYEIRF